MVPVPEWIKIKVPHRVMWVVYAILFSLAWWGPEPSVSKAWTLFYQVFGLVFWFCVFCGSIFYVWYNNRKLEQVRLDLIRSTELVIDTLSGGNPPSVLETLIKMIMARLVPEEKIVQAAWDIGHSLESLFHMLLVLDPKGDSQRCRELQIRIIDMLDPDHDQGIIPRAKIQEVLEQTGLTWLFPVQ